MVCGTPSEDIIESVKYCNSLVMVWKIMEVCWIVGDDSDARVFELALARLGIDCDSEVDSRRMDDLIAGVTVAERVSAPTSDD